MSSGEPINAGDDAPSTNVGRSGVQIGNGPTETGQGGPAAPASLSRAQSLSRRPAQQWPLLVVLAGVAIGLAFCFGEQWRLGCVIIGASLGIGAVERIALPRRNAGLLQVRGRAFDITIMLGLGVVIVALAIVVPGPHP